MEGVGLWLGRGRKPEAAKTETPKTKRSNPLTTTILCLVSLALVMWVILLKLEIATMMADYAKQHPQPDGHPRASGGAVKGMRKFEI